MKKSQRSKKAFTLTEVLITLTIVGVVASVLIPNWSAKYQKHVTVNKLKKAYSVLSQAHASSVADNGPMSEYLTPGSVVTKEKEKEYFQTCWLKYFKNPTVRKLPYGTYSSIYKCRNGSKTSCYLEARTDYSMGRIAISDNSGILYIFHNMKWQGDTALYADNVQIIVDLNGAKGPNMFGKDLFEFTANSEAVRPYGFNKNSEEINSNCSKNGTGRCCAGKIMLDDWEIKDDYPW